MDLNLVVGQRFERDRHNTFNGSGVTLNGILRLPDEPADAVYVVDVLVAITWAADDVGDHAIEYEVRGTRGAVLQKELRPFNVKQGTHGYGVHVERFAAHVPRRESLVRINARVGSSIRSWPVRVSNTNQSPPQP